MNRQLLEVQQPEVYRYILGCLVLLFGVVRARCGCARTLAPPL